MSNINKSNGLLHEIEVLFKQENEESINIYQKSVSANENEKHARGSPKIVNQKLNEKALPDMFTPFVDTKDEKHDEEPAILDQKFRKVTSIKQKKTKDTPKLIEKPVPLMLIPYVGSPLAHDRRAKRRRIDFTADESETEEDSNTVLVLPKRKFNAKRLRLENTTKL